MHHCKYAQLNYVTIISSSNQSSRFSDKLEAPFCVITLLFTFNLSENLLDWLELVTSVMVIGTKSVLNFPDLTDWSHSPSLGQVRYKDKGQSAKQLVAFFRGHIPPKDSYGTMLSTVAKWQWKCSWACNYVGTQPLLTTQVLLEPHPACTHKAKEILQCLSTGGVQCLLLERG